jgi:hypothetical protein
MLDQSVRLVNVGNSLLRSTYFERVLSVVSRTKLENRLLAGPSFMTQQGDRLSGKATVNTVQQRDQATNYCPLTPF